MTTEKPSIESLRATRRGLWAYMRAEEIIAFDAAFDELESLRAENARLVAERDALKQWHDQHEEREAASCPEDVGCIEFIGYLKDSLTAERARADALAARVEALRPWAAHLEECSEQENGPDTCDCGLTQLLKSTPSADLEAHDARVRREACEAIHRNGIPGKVTDSCGHEVEFVSHYSVDLLMASILGPDARKEKP